jgi:hypothetical protein
MININVLSLVYVQKLEKQFPIKICRISLTFYAIYHHQLEHYSFHTSNKTNLLSTNYTQPYANQTATRRLSTNKGIAHCMAG